MILVFKYLSSHGLESCVMMHAILILSEGTLGLLAVLASVLAIIFILVSKGYKKFVHRLTLYLIVAVQFDGVVSILQAVLVHHNGTIVGTMEELRGHCAAAGFLTCVMDWMILSIICWIVSYFVICFSV